MYIKDLARLSEAVYSMNQCSPDLPERAAVSSWDGFQAASYMLEGKLVVAFRGTEVWGDGVSDVALGLGANSAYFELGERFVQQVVAQRNQPVSVVCGHSLGGAIAQVVANRLNIPMVSFNAPGVAVLASRNLASASPTATAIRFGGMVASALVRPGQALRDTVAAFRPGRGLNVRVDADPVSRIGVHYGEMLTVPQSSVDDLIRLGIITEEMSMAEKLLARHSIATVNRLFETSPSGSLPVPS